MKTVTVLLVTHVSSKGVGYKSFSTLLPPPPTPRPISSTVNTKLLHSNLYIPEKKGNRKTCDRKTGNRKTGDRKTGDRKKGDRKTNCRETGYRKTGYRKKVYRKTG
jgi:hypothetical protein